MTHPDLVLIDDDELIRAAWLMVARARGHQLSTFSSYEEFEKARIDPSVPIYVDLNLANDVCGIVIARNLLSSGYRKVFLSTGMEITSDLPRGISGVIGKEYPKITS